jgi:drug/metabolite transporter (DMT)-like permease
VLGIAGVVMFAATLPATRLAVGELAPEVVGLGRTLPAAGLAAAYLVLVGAPRPTMPQFRRLAVTALGVVFGFPLLTALAMRQVDATHGGVVLAALPLATAAFGAWFGRERPSLAFWILAVLGACSVATFTLVRGAGEPVAGDLYLAGAAIAGGAGYAMGGVLAREMPGLHVISWALVLSLPILLPMGAWLWGRIDWAASPVAWLAFVYVAVGSQFVGFYFWYRGLALGGIARVSQLQLLQTFLTLGLAAALLGERIDGQALGFAALTVALVWFGRRARVAR